MTCGHEELFSVAVCAVLTVIFACGFLAARSSLAEREKQAHAHAVALDVASRVVSASVSGIDPASVLNASFESSGRLSVRAASVDGHTLLDLGLSGDGHPDASVYLPGVVCLGARLVPCSIAVDVWEI